MALFRSVLFLAAVALAIMIGYIMIDRFDEGSLKGKRVLVTGASQGIGEELAYQYARYGAKLVITARRESALQRVLKQCKDIAQSDEGYHYVVADMGKMAETERVVKYAVDKLGGLDFIVLNHVRNQPQELWSNSKSDFAHLDAGFEVNFKAYVHLASHAMPHLEKSNGSIIVLSSGFGRLSTPCNLPYSAQKFALEGFFNGLRQELIMREKDVSVTLCIIGLVATEVIKQELGDKAEELQKYMTAYPPADVALAIVKGGALRQRVVHYPFWQTALITYLRDIWPTILESRARFLIQLLLTEE